MNNTASEKQFSDEVLREIVKGGFEENIAAPEGALALEYEGRMVYPLWQFRKTKPPVLHEVFVQVGPLLGLDEDPMGAASWWVTPNAWLGYAPAELLGRGHDDDIVMAADQLSNDNY